MAKRECIITEQSMAYLLQVRVRTLLSQTALARKHDPDGIHDMRVASRRLRTVLGEAGPVFGAREIAAFLEAVREITRLLGVARELDVSIGLLDQRKGGLRGAERLAAVRTLAHMRALREAESANVESAADLAESPEFAVLLAALEDSQRSTASCHLERGEKGMRRRLRKVVKAHAIWRASGEPEDLHLVRIAFKKLRYTCELYETVYGEPLAKYIKQVKQAQEALGVWNDDRVLREYVLKAEPGAAIRALPGFAPLRDSLQADMDRQMQAFRDSAGQFTADDPVRVLDDALALPGMRCGHCTHTPPAPPKHPTVSAE
jgi:CHAD domain-containing protein